MERLRVTQNKQEIVSIMMEAMISGVSLTLWQIIQGQRKVIDVIVDSVTEHSVTLKIKDESYHNIPFNSDLKIYLHGPYRSILFKESALSVYNDSIVMALPEEIRLHELRESPRYYFEEKHAKIVNFEVVRLPNQKMSATLSDISKGGLCFYLPHNHSLLPKAQDTININFITDQTIPLGLSGKIVYARLTRTKNQVPQIYFGVQFKETKIAEIKYNIGEALSVKTIEELNQKDKDYNESPYGLTGDQRLKALHSICSTNSKIGIVIEKNVIYLEKINQGTPRSLQLFYQNNPIPDIAFALKLSSKKLISFIMKGLSRHSKMAFIAELEKKIKPAALLEAQEKIIRYIKTKETCGEFKFTKE